jgi:hypothetical protein
MALHRFSGSMTADEFCLALGIERTTLNQWLRPPAGILHGVPREPGRYTRGDILVGLFYVEIQNLLGDKSDKSALYTLDAAPRLRAMADAGKVPERIRLQIGDSPTTLTIDVCPYQLLQHA